MSSSLAWCFFPHRGVVSVAWKHLLKNPNKSGTLEKPNEQPTPETLALEQTGQVCISLVLHSKCHASLCYMVMGYLKNK